MNHEQEACRPILLSSQMRLHMQLNLFSNISQTQFCGFFHFDSVAHIIEAAPTLVGVTNK